MPAQNANRQDHCMNPLELEPPLDREWGLVVKHPVVPLLFTKNIIRP